MKKQNLLVVKILIALCLFTSCISELKAQKITGNQLIAIEERSDLTNFNSINISAGLDAIITQGEKEFVEVEADQNILEYITTKVEGNTLIIRWKKGINIRKHKKATVHITLRELSGVNASSGADVVCNDVIKTDEISINLSSGADIKLKLDAKNIKANASSGADLILEGIAEKLDVNASSGADIKASKLKAQDVIADASSAAEIKVYAVNTIKANASSGADIDYYGNPKYTNNHSSSGGDIDKK